MQSFEIYQFQAWLRGISPLIWRRLLVRSDQTVADLHYALQIAFRWSDSHLNSFRIQGKDYGVHHMDGPFFHEDANTVCLAQFHFRPGERFLYEYNFRDHWEHQIRLERVLSPNPAQTYPICTGGKRSVPPEDCGGVWAFQQQLDEAPWRGQELLEQIAECARERDITALRDLAEEIPTIQKWLRLNRFDRREVNDHLRQYVSAGADWRWPQEGAK